MAHHLNAQNQSLPSLRPPAAVKSLSCNDLTKIGVTKTYVVLLLLLSKVPSNGYKKAEAAVMDVHGL
jgi:hypothetical protein